MYEQVGQARAFRIVQDHFRYIQAAVRGNRGAIVKTIGDAVMAVFPTVTQAVRAAFEMQREMSKLETYGSIDPTRFLKVGIHSGPCLAVTLNDRLDYFGTTVNIAARLESLSTGSDVIISRALYEDPEVREFIAAEDLQTAPFEMLLKGFQEERFELWRVGRKTEVAEEKSAADSRG